jgi:hypothetical protein
MDTTVIGGETKDDIKKAVELFRTRQETASHNFDVDRSKWLKNLQRVQRQLLEPGLTAAKKEQLEKRLKKLQRGAGR